MIARVIAAAAVGALTVGALAACTPGLASVAPDHPLPSRTVAAAASSVAPSSAAEAGSCSAGAATAPTVAWSDLPAGGGFSDRVGAAAGRVVSLGARSVAMRGFVPADGTEDGGVVGPDAAGLVGAGAERTVLQVAPRSSTSAADIPTTYPATNQLDVLRVTGGASLLRGFTVQGTDQGHPYNGLRVDRVQDLRASDLRVIGIPGDDKQPPGETFGIDDFRTTGSQWSHVVVDGRGVGASGFGVNSSTDIRICDTVSTNNAHAMGFAFWQTSGITLVDCRATDNGFSGFNFERVSGTTTLVRPVATGDRYGMRIATDGASGRYTIIDPQLTDGRWAVTLPKQWNGTANRQLRSDITLIVGGKQRDDLLRFVTY